MTTNIPEVTTAEDRVSTEYEAELLAEVNRLRALVVHAEARAARLDELTSHQSRVVSAVRWFASLSPFDRRINLSIVLNAWREYQRVVVEPLARRLGLDMKL